MDLPARERLELADLRPRDVALGEGDHVPHPADAVALRAQRRSADVGVQGVAVIGDDLLPACPGDHAEGVGEGVRGPRLGANPAGHSVRFGARPDQAAARSLSR